MKVQIYSLVLMGAFLAGCQTNPKAVNSQRDLPIVPMVVPGKYEGNASPLKTALSGQVLLRSDFPIPLSKVRIGLFRIIKDEKKLVHEFSTGSDGSFQITRPIERGSYELQVTDPRYEGSLLIPDLNEPIKDLLFEVQKRAI